MSTHIGAIYRVCIDTVITLEPKNSIIRKFIPAVSIQPEIPFRLMNVMGRNKLDARKTLIEDIKHSPHIWNSVHGFKREVWSRINASVKGYSNTLYWGDSQIKPGTRVDYFLGLDDPDEIADFFVNTMVDLEELPWGYYEGETSTFLKMFDCMGTASRNKLYTFVQDTLSEISSAHSLVKILPIDCFGELIANRVVKDEQNVEVDDNEE